MPLRFPGDVDLFTGKLLFTLNDRSKYSEFVLLGEHVKISLTPEEKNNTTFNALIIKSHGLILLQVAPAIRHG